ncbi:MAG: toprim domain-containing protein [Anaerolineales bacterium]
MQNILNQAQELLGSPVRVEKHRGWAIFWCPFHNDAARSGLGGRPNFGVNILSEKGYWKCLRCGEAGSSLTALRRKLGVHHPPPVTPYPQTRSRSLKIDEALAESRSALLRSPAWKYIQKRGIRPYIALLYGLGYGVSTPKVHQDTVITARRSRLIAHDGHWLWAGGVVYADPLTNPTTIQVRHLQKEAGKKYQTWGHLRQPLGAWRLKASSQIAIVVEGMFDMLMFAQAIHDRHIENILPVFTGGASVSWSMQQWFLEHNQYGYILVPDADEAGEEWTTTIQAAIHKGKGICHVTHPPDGLDPDEALLQGWWPSGI